MGLALRRTVLTPGFNPSRIRWQIRLDADTLTGEDESAVASWTDTSGYARHATQGTGGNQPLLILDALNGHNAVRFDGTDDFVNNASVAVNQPYVLAAVLKVTSTLPPGSALVMISLAAAIEYSTAATTGNLVWNAGTGRTVGVTTNTTTVHIVAANGADTFVRLNGAQPVDVGNGGTNATTRTAAGARVNATLPTAMDAGFIGLAYIPLRRDVYALERWLRHRFAA